MNLKLAVVLLLLTILVIFVVQNYEVVEIKFLFWMIEASQAIVLFLTLTAGVITGWILAQIRKSHKIS